MNIMTKKEYDIYRLEMQSKCNGADPHDYNSLLGTIINIISVMPYLKKRASSGDIEANEKIAYYEKMYEDSMRSLNEISKLQAFRKIKNG